MYEMINHPINHHTCAVREIHEMKNPGANAYIIVDITCLLSNIHLFSLDVMIVIAKYAHNIPNIAQLAPALKL